MAESQRIAYISDVGAAYLKPLFITGCVITTVFLDISFAADRWLRHKGRLVPNTTTSEKVLSGLTIVFAIIGTAGLILLSVFDTARYQKLHNVFLLFFIAGYILSAVFICWEYQRLGIRNREPEHRVLRISFWIKLAFVIVEILLAIGFVACTFTKNYNPGAVLEWIIAFIFSFYVFSFYIDLWPAVYTKDRGYRYRNKKSTVDVDNQHSRSHGGGSRFSSSGDGTFTSIELDRQHQQRGLASPSRAYGPAGSNVPAIATVDSDRRYQNYSRPGTATRQQPIGSSAAVAPPSRGRDGPASALPSNF